MKYRLVVNGYGSQIVIGSIPEPMYTYWTTVGDASTLDERLFPNFNKDGVVLDNDSDPDDYTPENIGMWKHHNDMLSMCSPFIDYIHLKVYDENDNMVWATDTIDPVYNRVIDTNDFDKGHYIMCAFDKKGMFTELYIETTEFSPDKIKFHSKSIDSIEYLDKIIYEGKMRKSLNDDSQRHADEDYRRYKFIKNT